MPPAHMNVKIVKRQNVMPAAFFAKAPKEKSPAPRTTLFFFCGIH